LLMEHQLSPYGFSLGRLLCLLGIERWKAPGVDLPGPSARTSVRIRGRVQSQIRALIATTASLYRLVDRSRCDEPLDLPRPHPQRNANAAATSIRASLNQRE